MTLVTFIFITFLVKFILLLCQSPFAVEERLMHGKFVDCDEIGILGNHSEDATTIFQKSGIKGGASCNIAVDGGKWIRFT